MNLWHVYQVGPYYRIGRQEDFLWFWDRLVWYLETVWVQCGSSSFVWESDNIDLACRICDKLNRDLMYAWNYTQKLNERDYALKHKLYRIVKCPPTKDDHKL